MKYRCRMGTGKPVLRGRFRTSRAASSSSFSSAVLATLLLLISHLTAKGTDSTSELQSIAAMDALAGTSGDAVKNAQVRKLYENYVERNPQDARGFSLFGLFLMREGELQPAAAQLEKAAALEPKIADHRVNLATLYASQGRMLDAAHACREALEIRPEDASLHFQLATTLAIFRKEMASGEEAALADAMAHYRKAAELAPKNAEYWRGYAETFLILPNPDLGEARRAWEKYRENSTQKDFGTLQIARIAIRMGDRKEALKTLDSIQDGDFTHLRDKLRKQAEQLPQ